VPVPTIPVQCDYDSDESDGPILYRDDDVDDDEENMSEEGNKKKESTSCFRQTQHHDLTRKTITARLSARIARKDSLALKLAMRPDRQELIERGILHAQTERERHIQRETIGARLTRYVTYITFRSFSFDFKIFVDFSQAAESSSDAGGTGRAQHP
jgi:hypothetical protein